MDEEDWNATTDPQAMLSFLRVDGKFSERKFLLFAVACFRRLRRVLSEEEQRESIDILEQMAEGTATPEMRRRAARATRRTINGEFGEDSHYAATMLYRALVSGDAAGHAVHAVSGVTDEALDRAECSGLLRDIFGNPYWIPAIAPLWLSWNDGTILMLAEAAYQDPAQSSDTLDEHRLAILSDALEEAGCTDIDILDHLRSPGPHVRGCWVLDLILSHYR